MDTDDSYNNSSSSNNNNNNNNSDSSSSDNYDSSSVNPHKTVARRVQTIWVALLLLCLVIIMFIAFLVLGFFSVSGIIAELVMQDHEEDVPSAARIAVLVLAGVSWGCLAVVNGCAVVIAVWAWVLSQRHRMEYIV